MNLSILGPILAKNQFFLFQAFSPWKTPHFLQQKEYSNRKSEENNSGLELHFPLKSKCFLKFWIPAILNEPP